MLTRTSTTLLNSLLHDPVDQRAWRTVCERYGPAIYRFARRKGLSENDADEVLAETLAALFAAYSAGRYDRQRGAFKTWVFGIAMNKVREARRRLGPKNLGDVRTAVANHTQDQSFAEFEDCADPEYDADVDAMLARQCLEEVRRRVAPLTYQAFDLYVVKGRRAHEVARMLGIDTSAVYVAKSRVVSSARREYEKLSEQDQEV